MLPDDVTSRIDLPPPAILKVLPSLACYQLKVLPMCLQYQGSVCSNVLSFEGKCRIDLDGFIGFAVHRFAISEMTRKVGSGCRWGLQFRHTAVAICKSL
jgi:hypothetical protein